jgi:TPP-dependent pyruvate/acetoin dehydrogenase alpha subunit
MHKKYNTLSGGKMMEKKREQELYARFYSALYMIRRVEEEIVEVYPTDKIKSPVHLSIGQEAVAVGVCEALLPNDIVYGTYRSHALYLAKGGDLKQMIAELYGKITGCAKGKGGSMHLVDVLHGVMGTSAVVGTTIPNAVGHAYATYYQKKDRAVVSFFGDGAVEEGVFHESMNFAALKKLPIIFVCENNSYAIHTHREKRQGLTDITEKAQSYGINSLKIQDNDVFAIYDNISRARKALADGESGPYFFECITYRWKEHVGPGEDYELGYRQKSEAEQWKAHDAVREVGDLLDDDVKNTIETQVEKEIRDAFMFAEESSFPDINELTKDVFKVL